MLCMHEDTMSRHYDGFSLYLWYTSASSLHRKISDNTHDQMMQFDACEVDHHLDL